MSADLWDQILVRVEAKVNRHSFATWFRPTSYVALDGSRLRISVPNAQFREWLSKNYQGVLAEALREIGHPDLDIDFEEKAHIAFVSLLLEVAVQRQDRRRPGGVCVFP